jgi:hypothetical protein
MRSAISLLLFMLGIFCLIPKLYARKMVIFQIGLSG